MAAFLYLHVLAEFLQRSHCIHFVSQKQPHKVEEFISNGFAKPGFSSLHS